MINCKVLLGKPIDFIPQNSNGRIICQIYPPTVGEIIESRNINYIGLLTMTQEDIEDNYVEKNKNGSSNIKIPTPFEYILNSSPEDKKLICAAIEFFIKEPVSFLDGLDFILIGDLGDELMSLASIEDLRVINEENFFEFQNLIRQSVGAEKVERPNPNEHPKIRAMKAKARLRDKVKAKSNKNIKLESTLAAICCMGIGITPLNIGEITYGSIHILMSMYQGKEKYELDIDSLLAGADSKKVKPKYWIKNLND